MSIFKNPRTALATATTSAALLGAGAVAAVTWALDDEPSPPPVAAAAATPAAAESGGLSVAEIYERASSSVVEITVTTAGEQTPFGGSRGGQSQGSGFVYDDDGHVVTNQHVVDGATRAEVTFADGKTFDATVVGADPSTDLAVLKVDAPAAALKPLELADMSSVQIGEGVVAIGSPFGLDQTVTSGIVSALGRQITAPNQFAIDDAIQTDAAINHGNSGGPLLDLDGRVIGVNSQINSESGGNDGVGFAVPADTVERIAAALIADGEVQHAYLGVSTEDADGGARIADVRPGTPAAGAGLRAGDLVTEIDGEAVADADALRASISDHAPGDRIELTIRRGGDTRQLDVTLGTRPSA